MCGALADRVRVASRHERAERDRLSRTADRRGRGRDRAAPPAAGRGQMIAVLALPEIEPTATAAALRADVRAFLAARDVAARCDSWGSAWGWSPQLSRALGAQGWLGMTWPRRYGGLERSALERFVVIEELLAAGAPVAAHWVADRQSGPAILRLGSEEQRRRLLPAMARGETYFAIAMSEEGSGSDLAS